MKKNFFKYIFLLLLGSLLQLPEAIAQSSSDEGRLRIYPIRQRSNSFYIAGSSGLSIQSYKSFESALPSGLNSVEHLSIPNRNNYFLRAGWEHPFFKYDDFYIEAAVEFRQSHFNQDLSGTSSTIGSFQVNRELNIKSYALPVFLGSEFEITRLGQLAPMAFFKIYGGLRLSWHAERLANEASITFLNLDANSTSSDIQDFLMDSLFDQLTITNEDNLSFDQLNYLDLGLVAGIALKVYLHRSSGTFLEFSSNLPIASFVGDIQGRPGENAEELWQNHFTFISDSKHLRAFDLLILKIGYKFQKEQETAEDIIKMF